MAASAGRRAGILTARQVETARTPGLIGDGNGLYLKVGDNGAKSWIVRWSRGGSVRKLGLGATHTVPLAMARERAAEVRLMILDGIDPREARRTAAKSITFDQACDKYIEAHAAAWRTRRHAKQWRSSLATHASPVLGKLPVSAVDVGLILRVLSPIWTIKTPVAKQLRGRIEAILSWAKVHNYRTGENPAIWRDNLAHLLPASGKVHKTQHHAALPYDQIPAFMNELNKRDDVAARALEFAILTAARTSEVLSARWAELDLSNRLWIVPAGRMKSGREHRVPLSDRALAIVGEMQAAPRNADFVFPSAKRGRPLIGTTFKRVLCSMGHGEFTGHGFRSTFRDWAAERTNYQNHVIEMALAHAIRDQVERSYRRGDLLDKRRQLMAAWGEYCARPVNNVIALAS